MKRIWLFNSILFLSLWSNTATAQRNNLWQEEPDITLSGFIDVFYVYDFNQPQSEKRQDFIFNHNRHHEFNLNLGLVKLDLEHHKYRASFALQAGTYADDNYAAESGLAKNIYEAHVGISLNSKNNLWLDAGILPSHIGFESAVSSNNMTLTRSLSAENSPYYLTGAKVTYHPSEKWELAGLVVNGWQRIQRVEGNSLLSFGSQLMFRPQETIVLNWSSFIGTDDSDINRRIRYFNNFYGQFQLSDKLAFITGFDLGIQQRMKNSSVYDFWLSPVVIGQYSMGKGWKTAIRAEYYQDKKGIIIPSSTAHGFRTTGLSINLDYEPSKNIVCRLEGRWLKSKDRIFETSTIPTSRNLIIASSIAIRLSQPTQ